MGVSVFVGIFAAFLCHFQINNETIKAAKTTKNNDPCGKWGSHSFYCIFYAAPLGSLIALMCASKLGAPNLSLEVVGWRCLHCPMHCNRRKWATCTPASWKLGFRDKGLPNGVALFLILLLHLGFDNGMENNNQTATQQIEHGWNPKLDVYVDVWSIRQQSTTQGQRTKKTLNKSKLKK